MRILLLTPMLPRADGAGAIPILLHAQLLGLRQQHEVTLVSAVGDEPGDTEAAARLRSSGIDARLADRRQPHSAADRWRRRWRLARSWAFSRRPWRTVWFADPGVQHILDRLAVTESFDIVAVEDSAMSGYRLPDGVPAVLTEHEAHRASLPDWWRGPLSGLPQRAVAALDWRRWDGFQRRAWSRFERIQVFSRGDAEAIAAAEPSLAPTLRIDPFGIELPRASDPGREEPATVLFVGNFTHPPNRDAAAWLAAEVMPAIRARIAEARLRIVGSSPPPAVLALAGPAVEVVADALSVEPHIEAASVVVAPMRTGGGMRMKVLEAIARGKPVVTTPLGVEGLIEFDEAPPVLIGDSADEIAALTADLLADPGRRRELGLNARSFSERHCTPQAWASRLTQVYEETIAAARG